MQVIVELKNYDYPLDESLKTCQKNGILDATAFLYERSGDITKAINLYFEVIYTPFKQNILKFNKRKGF